MGGLGHGIECSACGTLKITISLSSQRAPRFLRRKILGSYFTAACGGTERAAGGAGGAGRDPGGVVANSDWWSDWRRGLGIGLRGWEWIVEDLCSQVNRVEAVQDPRWLTS